MRTPPSIERFAEADSSYRVRRQRFAETIGAPTLWSIMDQWGLYVGVQSLATKLAVYDIFRQVLKVPGHIAEFGCWQGANLLFMAKLLQILEPNTHTHLYGFDHFKGLVHFSAEDRKAGPSKRGAYRGNEANLRAAIDLFQMGDYVHLVRGDVQRTIPVFARKNPHLLFRLAYLDLDLYKPCRAALDFVVPRLSPGGIIVFDEALMHSWPGEGKALVDQLQKKEPRFTMHHIPYARQPTVYLVKNP